MGAMMARSGESCLLVPEFPVTQRCQAPAANALVKAQRHDA
ncbi:hypothetical protein QTI66_25280 [Variovorax sp. J22R133]|nr:hypothetical protein [Variovorax sp. J22R133]MDM0115486.1 hypothetical protein [Variovorax sp. J22R133]